MTMPSDAAEGTAAQASSAASKKATYMAAKSSWCSTCQWVRPPCERRYRCMANVSALDIASQSFRAVVSHAPYIVTASAIAAVSCAAIADGRMAASCMDVMASMAACGLRELGDELSEVDEGRA